MNSYAKFHLDITYNWSSQMLGRSVAYVTTYFNQIVLLCNKVLKDRMYNLCQHDNVHLHIDLHVFIN
jgi:hypothetical protein